MIMGIKYVKLDDVFNAEPIRIDIDEYIEKNPEMVGQEKEVIGAMAMYDAIRDRAEAAAEVLY